jgi:hypothetical protein
VGTSARITTISASSGGPAESMSFGPRYSFQRASDAFRIELRTLSTGVASESDRFTDPDTLVVDTIGFNEKSWLDGFGHPRIKGMRIRETYRRRDFGHLNVAVTIEDRTTTRGHLALRLD